MAGWRERVSLPRFDVDVVAKLDTGALSSSLHAEDIEALPGHRLRFRAPLDRDGHDWVAVEAPLVAWRWVRDSGGHGSMRPVIKTRIECGGLAWNEELTLFDRQNMQHRLLLGRRPRRGRFVVDPERVFLLAPHEIVAK